MIRGEKVFTDEFNQSIEVNWAGYGDVNVIGFNVTGVHDVMSLENFLARRHGITLTDVEEDGMVYRLDDEMVKEIQSWIASEYAKELTHA